MIFALRGERVILDADLAALYGVPTKALNQAVKRNPDRFPCRICVSTCPKGTSDLEVTNCDLKFSRRSSLYAFRFH